MAQQVNGTAELRIFGYAAPGPTNDTNVTLYLGTDLNQYDDSIEDCHLLSGQML